MTTALSSAALLAQGGWDGHMDWGGGWWVPMIFGMALFWALVLAAVVWLVRGWPQQGRREVEQTPRATEVLERRLAEGEISVEEYHERRKVLLGSSGEGSSGMREGSTAGGSE